jgi:predicted RNA binding protein YcfA (HicA-like mRNA interferase family)
MGTKSVYPKSNKEIIKLLSKLGFKKKLGISRGKHPEKYHHPNRRNSDLNDKPFVIVSHDYFDEKAKKTVKKLENWGFSQEELEQVMKDL